MTANEFLTSATKALKKAGIASARLDALILLEDALGQDRALILAHPDQRIAHSTEVALHKKIIQRASHTPLAYIRGKVQFYGRELLINQDVLVPRPETETMITLLKQLPLPPRPRLADIGTGSGCIGITAALELSGATVDLYDLDPATLAVARRNARTLGVKVRCYQADLLERPARPYDVLLANLPYVPERYLVNQAAEQEPKEAIFGGKDGLNLYRRFWTQISSLPDKPRFVLTEALPPQHAEIEAIAKQAGYTQRKAEDFIQVFER